METMKHLLSDMKFVIVRHNEFPTYLTDLEHNHLHNIDFPIKLGIRDSDDISVSAVAFHIVAKQVDTVNNTFVMEDLIGSGHVKDHNSSIVGLTDGEITTKVSLSHMDPITYLLSRQEFLYPPTIHFGITD